MPTENSTESEQNSHSGATGQQGNPGANGDGNQGGNAPSTPDAGQRSAPVATVQHNTAAQAPGPNFGEVIAAIQAMPEQVVRGLREATQAAQQPRVAKTGSSTGDAQSAAQTATEQGSGGGSAEKATHPTKKTFADWWFGG